MNQHWSEPDVSLIHLSNGHTIQTEVNGLDLDGMNGFVLLQGRDIEVARRFPTDNEWTEVPQTSSLLFQLETQI